MNYDRTLLPGVAGGDEVIRQIKDRTDSVLLSFSCGKDSIITWLAIKDHFKKIVPYFLYVVPDLEFVEKAIRYYEDLLGTRIYRMPHPALNRLLINNVYMPPERLDVVDAMRLKELDYADIRDAVAASEGLPKGTFDAKGVRAADSMMRRTHFKMRGGINWTKNYFYPVWDWKKAELVGRMRDAKIKVPVDYRLFGRSFDGIDFRFLYPIKQNFPEDYARILEWFPLAELEIKRYEYAQAHKKTRA